MRKLFATALTGTALCVASVASPALAAPNPNACKPRPNGGTHGTSLAHETVPHGNPAHASIPHYCH